MSAILDKIYEIDWASYETAYGSAEDVASDLNDLLSDNLEYSLNASHRLWCGLCHQHAYVSSAAWPAVPIIFDILRVCKDQIKVEILDILFGFASCTTPGFPDSADENWKVKLRHYMFQRLDEIKSLSKSTNEDVSVFALKILEEFEEYPAEV